MHPSRRRPRRKNEGDPKRRPEPTTELARHQKHRKVGNSASALLGNFTSALTQLAPERAKPVRHPVDDPVAAPRVEIVLDRRSGRKTWRNRPPLASGGEHKLGRIDHLPKVCLAGASSLRRRRKTRLHQIPFLIRQIAFKPVPRACILGFGGLVPRHVRLSVSKLTKDTTSWRGHSTSR